MKKEYYECTKLYLSINVDSTCLDLDLIRLILFVWSYSSDLIRLFFSVQRKWSQEEGEHFVDVDQELGDDVDHEHSQEVERVDSGDDDGDEVTTSVGEWKQNTIKLNFTFNIWTFKFESEQKSYSIMSLIWGLMLLAN